MIILDPGRQVRQVRQVRQIHLVARWRMRDNAWVRDATADVRPALAWRDRHGSRFHLATG
jgi:hypothetical protein